MFYSKLIKSNLKWFVFKDSVVLIQSLEIDVKIWVN